MEKTKKGVIITFSAIDDFTGQQIELIGTVIGFGADVRRMWPMEMEEAPDNMLLVRRQDSFGNTFHHAIDEEEIIEKEE